MTKPAFGNFTRELVCRSILVLRLTIDKDRMTHVRSDEAFTLNERNKISTCI